MTTTKSKAIRLAQKMAKESNVGEAMNIVRSGGGNDTVFIEKCVREGIPRHMAKHHVNWIREHAKKNKVY